MGNKLNNEQENILTVLETDKLKLEIEILKNKNKTGNPMIDPVLATILVALLGFLGTTIVSVYSAKNERDLKQREFEYNLITKALSQPTKEQQISLLIFIDTLQLIKDKDISLNLKAQLKNPANIPSISPSSISDVDYVPIKVKPEFRPSSEPLTPLASFALKAAQKETASSDSLNNQSDGSKMIQKYFLSKDSLAQFGGWGCAFVSWCYSQNPVEKPPFDYTGSFIFLVDQLKSKGMYVNSARGIRPGDIYFIKPGQVDHLIHHGGIVETVTINSIIALHAKLGDHIHPIFRQKIEISNIAGYGRVE